MTRGQSRRVLFRVGLIYEAEASTRASRVTSVGPSGKMPLLTFRAVPANASYHEPFYSSDDGIRRQVMRRLAEVGPQNEVSSSTRCRALPERFTLSEKSMLDASANGTVFVTFSDSKLSQFALNWARRLQVVGLRSLIGISEKLQASAELGAQEASATLFCAEKAGMMAANGQAGRWAEAIPVLRMARRLKLSVLLSDADIAWIRNPLPYFSAARASHPGIDLLMMTDRAFNGYSASPLRVQPPRDAPAVRPPNGGGGKAAAMGVSAGGTLGVNPILGGMRRIGVVAARKGGGGLGSSGSSGMGGGAIGIDGEVDLELEPGFESSISYNIGVILFCDHALLQLESMVERWVVAVGGVGSRGGLFGRGGRANLAVWDQEPINKQVLQVGLSPDARDRRLVRVDSGRVAMGVLPMLQFTTSFTYHSQRRRRESLRARPYCLHAIFAHGKDTDRKISIFREEQLWHDPPSYYDPPPGPDGRPTQFLVAEPVLPQALVQAGGFELLQTQFRQIHAAFRLAALLNLTYVLPRLKCGERPMAYPCYAWYHRSMAYFGLNTDKVSMPEHCPMYYWLDLTKLKQLPVATREPGFLENERTPSRIKASRLRVRLCQKGAACGGAAASGKGASAADVPEGSGEAAAMYLSGSASVGELVAAVRTNRNAASARVLRVQHLQWLTLHDSALRSDPAAPLGPSLGPSLGPAARAAAAARFPSRASLEQLTRGFWCTACPVTRRGAVIHELNRSSLHMLETFCKTEARGRLGLGPPMRSCCPHGQRLPCHQCAPWERGTVNETDLPWYTRSWIPTYARLEISKSAMGEDGRWPTCTHPLCTGADRKSFP